MAASANFLEVFTSPDIKEVTNEMIDLLLPLKDQISWLSLPQKSLNDGLLESIGKLEHLSKLKIQNNPLSDTGLSHLSNLKNLEVLNLYNTRITDESIDILTQLKTLKSLFLWQSEITPEGIEVLQDALPNTDIVAGLNFAENKQE